VVGGNNWVAGGLKGAGARLGLQSTTLISKMQKLGSNNGIGFAATDKGGIVRSIL
jgi:hypothetical protein